MKSVNLKFYSGFGCGGTARKMYEVENIEELAETLERIKSERGSYYILGNGYNTLIADGRINKDIIKLKNSFSKINVRGTEVDAGAGAGLSELLNTAAGRGLAGLEFMSGIPGTVGAAVYLNSGTAERYIGRLIRSVRLFNTRTMKLTELENDRLKFKYRSSSIEPDNIMAGCTLGLKRGNKSDIIKTYRKNLAQKKMSQPLNKKSCGCIFKNPQNSALSAGQLIEKAGFKGRREGGAEVSSKHANFIINRDNASSKDIYRLINAVRKGVKKEFNIELDLEIKLLGYESQ